MSSPPERPSISEEPTASSKPEPIPDPCPAHDDELSTTLRTTTVMIYLAGDNNLSEECVYALTELKKALPPSGTVRVLAQYDPADEFLPTQRYRIRFDNLPDNPRPIARDLIDQYPFRKESESKAAFYIRPPFGERKERKGEGGTGDPKMLYNFIAFCVDQHPKTDYYVLIVCGHGAGIYRDFLLRDNRPDGYLTIYELRQALRWMYENLKDKSGDPLVLDIFGMDVCLMSMAEVTYELRDYVKYAIGSESYSPAAGWPYRQTINQIDYAARKAIRQQNSPTQGSNIQQPLPELNWGRIGKKIVKEYVRFYSDYWLAGLSVSMSAIDVRQIYKLKELVGRLSDMMILELKAEANEREKWMQATEKNHNNPRHPHKFSFADVLVLAHWRAQSYNGELYVDLVDFCNCLIPYAPPYIKEACEKLTHFIVHDLVLISCTWGRHYQYSYGISIYFPWDSLMPYYGASIQFPTKSRWVHFLSEYIAATRRAPRRYPRKEDQQDDARVVRKILRENLADARMGSDKMGSDKMGSDKGGNPIHSMRNPPIVFIPDPCVEDKCVRWHNNRAQADLMKDVEDFHDDRTRANDDVDPENPKFIHEVDDSSEP